MATEVSICNQALGFLGANLITSLDDDTTEAKLCKANYVPVRDAVLEAHNWTFATKWYQLPALSNPPLSEFANAYELPPEVLRVVFVGQDYEHPTRWQVEGKNIVTDETTCKCQTIILVEDPNRFSSLFVQALSARLAADMAIPLTNSRTLMETHLQVYEAKMQEAVSIDNLQGKTRRMRSRWLHNSRAQGPRTAGPYV